MIAAPPGSWVVYRFNSRHPEVAPPTPDANGIRSGGRPKRCPQTSHRFRIIPVAVPWNVYLHEDTHRFVMKAALVTETAFSRIVHITTVPMSLAFLRGQIGYIKARGFEIAAISSPGLLLEQFGQDEGIATHSVELPRRITPFHDLKAVTQLARVLRNLRPVIVHAHTPKGGLLGMISSWMARTPIRIYHMRGLPYMTATGNRRRLLKATERISCRLAHRVFCVSHSLREVAIADDIVPADKIIVFGGGSGNGVDAIGRFNPDRFTADDVAAKRAALGIATDDLVIGFIGRIVRDKGIEELAQAWAKLREDHPNVRLVLVGPLEPQDPVDPDIVAQLQRDDRVLMIDWLDDTSGMYPVFDLLVLPTYREGFPNVPLEAAAMGIPVVATRIPGCIDAVQDGITGTLVPVQDADALANVMQSYLENPELRRRHGAAGRERVIKEFRQELIWEAVYQEYCQLLTGKGLPVPTPKEEPQ